jgi:predicted component of type VI protein secretion system
MPHIEMSVLLLLLLFPQQQEMNAFEASVEGELDLTQPAPAQGPAAVARQMDRMMSFLTSLTDAADDVLAEIEKIQLPDGQVSHKHYAHSEPHLHSRPPIRQQCSVLQSRKVVPARLQLWQYRGW